MAEKQENWVDVCGEDELPEPGCGHYVEAAGRKLAVFVDGDESGRSLRAMDDSCPHAGASLSMGPTHEGCVVCPWHGWMFDLESGKCPDNEAVGVKVYPVRVHGGRVEVLV